MCPFPGCEGMGSNILEGWRLEERVEEQIQQCRCEQHVKEGKSQGIICAMLGAYLSCAQKKFKESPPPARIAHVEHPVLKSENKMLKTSPAFEKENQEKLGTDYRELKMLSTSAERQEKQL